MARLLKSPATVARPRREREERREEKHERDQRPDPEAAKAAEEAARAKVAARQERLERAKDERVKDEPAKEERSKGERAKDEPAKEERSKGERAKDEPAKEEYAKEDRDGRDEGRTSAEPDPADPDALDEATATTARTSLDPAGLGLDPAVRTGSVGSPDGKDSGAVMDPDQLDLADSGVGPVTENVYLGSDVEQWESHQAQVAEHHEMLSEAEEDLAEAYEDLAQAAEALNEAHGEGDPGEIQVAETMYQLRLTTVEHHRDDMEDLEQQVDQLEADLQAFEADHAELVEAQTGQTPDQRAVASELEELRGEVRALERQDDASWNSDWSMAAAEKEAELTQRLGQAQVAEDQAQTELTQSLVDLQMTAARLGLPDINIENFDPSDYDVGEQLAGAVEAAGDGDLGQFAADWVGSVTDDVALTPEQQAELAQAHQRVAEATVARQSAAVDRVEAQQELDAVSQSNAARLEEEQELEAALQEARAELQDFEAEHAEQVAAYDAMREDPADAEAEARYAFEQAALEMEAAEDARLLGYAEVEELTAELDQLRGSGAPASMVIPKEIALETALARLDRFDQELDQAITVAEHAEDDLTELQEPDDVELGDAADPGPQLDITEVGDVEEAQPADEDDDAADDDAGVVFGSVQEVEPEVVISTEPEPTQGEQPPQVGEPLVAEADLAFGSGVEVDAGAPTTAAPPAADLDQAATIETAPLQPQAAMADPVAATTDPAAVDDLEQAAEPIEPLEVEDLARTDQAIDDRGGFDPDGFG